MVDSPARRPRSRRYQTVRAGYLLAMALISAGLGGEIFLRHQRSRVEPEVAQYRASNVFAGQNVHFGTAGSLWVEMWDTYRPNAQVHHLEPDELFELTTNRHGFRTRDFAVMKPHGTLRVICIGGSTTLQGTTNATTYPAFLEELLARQFPDRTVEVLNFGVSGTRSGQWLKPAEEASEHRRIDALLNLQPDLVVQYNGANDIVHLYIERYLQDHPTRAWLLRRSLLAQRLLGMHPTGFDPSFDETLANFRTIRQACAEAGVHYLVSTFAAPAKDQAASGFRHYLDIVTADWSQGLLHYYGTYEQVVERFNQRLQEFAQAEGIALAQAHRAIRHPDDFIDLCHMNTSGIRKLAEAMLPAAATLLRLPTPATQPRANQTRANQNGDG